MILPDFVNMQAAPLPAQNPGDATVGSFMFITPIPGYYTSGHLFTVLGLFVQNGSIYFR